MIKRFTRNTAGRDFAVGDIHGHFTRLTRALEVVNFNPAVDRLFSVGDLVDRGPECEDALQWLALPWFHPVRGNHDDKVCRYDTCDTGNWLENGGAWFAGMPSVYQAEYAAAFRDLPLAIEVETAGGLVGIIHADCPFPDWSQLQFELTGVNGKARLKQVMNTCMWSRTRVEFDETHGVTGLRALVVGHTPQRKAKVLGNVYHIDTGGWKSEAPGHFTLLNLETLAAVAAQPHQERKVA